MRCASDLVGRSGDMVVIRTADGGYRCAGAQDVPMNSDDRARLASVPDATTIYRLDLDADELDVPAFLRRHAAPGSSGIEG